MHKSGLVLSVILICFFGTWLHGQINQKLKKVEDAGIQSQGKLTLRFTDASIGLPLAYASIAVKGNKSVLTDNDGKIVLERKPDGVYPVKFEKQGYISETFAIEVLSGRIVHNRFTVSPVLKKGNLRFVLAWNEKPMDLDIGFKMEEGFTISPRDSKSSLDEQVILESTCEEGYGPESILVKQVDQNALYSLYVKNISDFTEEGKNKLAPADPRIKIYKDNALKRVLIPSEKQAGNKWTVFSIQNGQIVLTDQTKED